MGFFFQHELVHMGGFDGKLFRNCLNETKQNKTKNRQKSSRVYQTFKEVLYVQFTWRTAW